MEEEKKYWVWLNSIPGVGSVTGRLLLEYFEHPHNLWKAPAKLIRTLSFLKKELVERLSDKKLKEKAEADFQKVCSLGLKVISITDQEYPQMLKSIYDPPVVLYMKGTADWWNNVAVAVVGSRQASLYGRTIAERLSYELSQNGITVVSGMARGIDSYAHNGALRAGGCTVAVLGCGLDTAYPQENRGLMEKISLSGAVISEYLPGIPPIPLNFPARNRIISGLSVGVLVVEAGEKSGSLITANFALEQGREVLAVPGNIDNMSSRGTNKLIREGAKIVTELDDILEELNVVKSAYNSDCSKSKSDDISKLQDKNRKALDSLDKDEMKIVQCMLDEPAHIDNIARDCGMGIQIVNSLLVMLELKCIVEQLPGKIFRLKH